MQIWLCHGDVVYYHLGASDSEGYALGASYAVYAAAIAWHRDARILHLGGDADTGRSRDGLVRVKQGFANATATAYLCGAILHPERYQILSAPGCAPTGFFPAYRG